MEKDYKEHITADNLFEEKQIGSTTIYPIEGGNCRYIGIKAKCGYKNQFITDVYSYDNNNVLVKFVDINNSRALYLLVSESTFSCPYDSISLKVYDEKYRIAYTNDRVCVISEKSAQKTISESKWKNIIDINNDIAIINSKGNYYNLVRLNFETKWGNELQGSKEITYIDNYLYKYRNIETRYKYLLYNAKQPASSNPMTLYDDIQCISEQFAVGIITGVQWDFIKFNSKKDGYLEVAFTSYKEPVYNGDDINLAEFDDYGNEIPYVINKWGANLSDEPEEGTEEPVAEVRGKDLPQTKNLSLNEQLAPQDENIEIGKVIVVANESVKKSEHGEYLHFNYSFRKACDCVGYPCWILLKQKLIVITEKKGRGGRTDALSIVKKGALPSDFEQFSNISQDNKWLYFEKSLIAPETEIIDEVINIISPEIKKLAEEHKESIEVQQKRDIEDTKDILRLKAIYDFLKLQGFDNLSISNAIASLFPEIEEFIDYTNVKQNYYHGWKRYVENVEKLKRIMPDGYVFDDSKVIEELKFTDNEKIMLDYYTKVKGYRLDVTMELIEEESPSGGELRKEYEFLMRLDDIVDNERIMLQREIIGDLVNNFTSMVDTSEMLKLPESSITSISSKEFVVDTSKSTDLTIKDVKHIFKLNESIKYDVFEGKSFRLYEKPVCYLKVGKNVVILLNREKAKEFDSEHARQLMIRGNGEDKKFDQDYNSYNGIIAQQRENGARIYVFECIDSETCSFFDEFQCIKDERIEDEKENRKIIYFTMKSLLRYNTDN